ncbi:hypothetical protein J437_LFUL005705 [Ladona fulva]|uniref:Uncharacterized protein n=1 Tax=Ladona fulva TaxID=123851 RepID=A0A8K0P0L8_LADFU|nr:hypothetical protein J437_LFUL005705 [Ladona fulva]
MLKMNYISVIACLGLLFGTLAESGAVSADVLPITGSKTNSSQTCENCTEDASSGSVPSKPQASSINQSVKLSTNPSPTPEKDGKVAPNISKDELTSGSQSHSDVANASVIDVPNNGTNDSPSTSEPTNDASTTQTTTTPVKPTTTPVKPTTTPSSTVEPPTPKTSTTEQTTTPETTTSSEKTTTTPVTPVPTPSTTSAVPSTSPTVISTKAAPTTQAPTDKPAEERRFDGPSFIGGIVFALGVTAIAFVAWKFYKARTERNYHTL